MRPVHFLDATGSFFLDFILDRRQFNYFKAHCERSQIAEQTAVSNIYRG